jgi:hypothetical protein
MCKVKHSLVAASVAPVRRYDDDESESAQVHRKCVVCHFPAVSRRNPLMQQTVNGHFLENIKIFFALLIDGA